MDLVVHIIGLGWNLGLQTGLQHDTKHILKSVVDAAILLCEFKLFYLQSSLLVLRIFLCMLSSDITDELRHLKYMIISPISRGKHFIPVYGKYLPREIIKCSENFPVKIAIVISGLKVHSRKNLLWKCIVLCRKELAYENFLHQYRMNEVIIWPHFVQNQEPELDGNLLLLCRLCLNLVRHLIVTHIAVFALVRQTVSSSSVLNNVRMVIPNVTPM